MILVWAGGNIIGAIETDYVQGEMKGRWTQKEMWLSLMFLHMAGGFYVESTVGKELGDAGKDQS